jgi:antitoxin (DNA-binding transcriptional repressor) of toxin-antitoxin stability system
MTRVISPSGAPTLRAGSEVAQVMKKTVSKSRFKAQALQWFREIERTGEDLIITDKGKPVLRVTRLIEEPEEDLRALRGSVLSFEDPTAPVGLDDWEALR